MLLPEGNAFRKECLRLDGLADGSRLHSRFDRVRREEKEVVRHSGARTSKGLLPEGKRFREQLLPFLKCRGGLGPSVKEHSGNRGLGTEPSCAPSSFSNQGTYPAMEEPAQAVVTIYILDDRDRPKRWRRFAFDSGGHLDLTLDELDGSEDERGEGP